MRLRGFAAIAAWFKRRWVRKLIAETVADLSVKPAGRKFEFSNPRRDPEMLPIEAYLGIPEPEVYGDWSPAEVLGDDWEDDDAVTAAFDDDDDRRVVYRTAENGFGFFNLSEEVRSLFWGDTPDIACRVCGSEMIVTDAGFLVCSGDDNPEFESCDGDAYDGT